MTVTLDTIEAAADSLRQAIESIPELAELKKNLLVE